VSVDEAALVGWSDASPEAPLAGTLPQPASAVATSTSPAIVVMASFGLFVCMFLSS
jgi:hypothetical protein